MLLVVSEAPTVQVDILALVRLRLRHRSLGQQTIIRRLVLYLVFPTPPREAMGATASRNGNQYVLIYIYKYLHCLCLSIHMDLSTYVYMFSYIYTYVRM